MSLTPPEQIALSTDNGPGPHVPYLVRRETHSSRALASTVMALLAIAVLIYLAVEGIFQMMGHKALLARPTAIWHAILSLPEKMTPLAIGIGVGLVILGLVFLAKAIVPGALGRHALADERAAYIVDDSMIASAVSRAVRERANLPAGQVTTSVSRGSLDVTAQPTSGLPLDQADLQAFTSERVNSYNLEPAVRTTVRIATEGQVAK